LAANGPGTDWPGPFAVNAFTSVVVLSLSLLVYGLVVPLLLAFTVARYQPPDALAPS
jgi:hypothetical protein